MMASRERLNDYFSVVGPRDADIENRVVPETYSIQNLHRSLEEAIVDIIVVNHPKEAIPWEENYELLLKPSQQNQDDDPTSKLQKHMYLCFRRRKFNRTNTFITEVKVLRKGSDVLPEGWEFIEKTVGGNSADLSRALNDRVFLAVKRQELKERDFCFSTPAMLLDLCLCSDKKAGAAPSDYIMVSRPLPKLGLPSEEIYLAYRHGPKAGLCDIPYEASTLEWHPHENSYEDFPLPQNELPMFCFPRGIHLKHEKADNAPMPSYFSFVFTSIDGDRVHVACLQFYEMLPLKTLRALETKQRILTVAGSFSPSTDAGGGTDARWDEDEDSVSSVEEDDEDDEDHEVGSEVESDDGAEPKPLSRGKTERKAGGSGRRHGRRHRHKGITSHGEGSSSQYRLFAPKCICIITHWPFYRGLRTFLQQIYRISLSPAAVPIERYISYFIHYLPLPPPGVHAIHLRLDLGLHDPIVDLPTSLEPIEFRLPDARSLPLMDLDFDAPFCCLSLDNVIKVFLLLLTEERLLFISSSTSLLTELTESLLTLLFPLEWLSCYIPRLPNKLTEILDAPGSFVLGIYTEGTTANWTAPPLSDPIFVVDLDQNRIFDIEGKSDVMGLAEGVVLVDALKDKIKAELDRANVTLQDVQGLRERDSAFRLSAMPGMDSQEEKVKLDPAVIRDAFLVFMCDLLGGYTKFFNSQESGDGTDGSAIFGAFDVQAFLGGVDKLMRPLLEKVVVTQMFAALIQQRMEHSHGIDRLVFFENCVQELRERRDVEALQASGKRAPQDSKAAARYPPRSPTPVHGFEGGEGSGRRGSAVLLLHQAVAKSGAKDRPPAPLAEGIVAEISPPMSPGQPVSVSTSSGGQSLLGAGNDCITIPGPGAEGCGPVGTSYSYTQFPTTLNKEWMNIPPTALPPVILQIISKRKKYMKKGNRMILARSVNECMKDWKAIAEKIGSGGGNKSKETHLSMQIFGIYFMCLPTRVTYKGRPLKIIMQAMGILQFLFENQVQGYMDEAMWRSLLVACGRCGHANTRKVAIALFEMMRKSGMTINALTYGQYTKALAEKDAVDFYADNTTAGANGSSGGNGNNNNSANNSAANNMTAMLQLNRVEIDDSPWLEEKGRNWYVTTCEPPPPETLHRTTTLSTLSVADNFRQLLSRAANARKGKGERAPLPEGEPWTLELRDTKLSAHNTTMSSSMLDSTGVIGMWTVCMCVNCDYIPLDEEIMSLRQDLLLVQPLDEDDDNGRHSSRHHLLLQCPRCEKPLMPRLYYDVTTFPELNRPTPRTGDGPNDKSHSPSPCLDKSTGLGSKSSSRDAGFFAVVDTPKTPSLRKTSSADGLALKQEMKGEISGCGLGVTAGDHVDYMSPFTLRMKLERLLLENGEEALTRDWARTHHPDVYWNLVWFTTRLSVPFPMLLDSLDLGTLEPSSAMSESMNGQPQTVPSGPNRGPVRTLSRRESSERLQNFFHEVVVVGWEGLVVRARCDKVRAMLLSRSFTRQTQLHSMHSASPLPTATTLPPPPPTSSLPPQLSSLPQVASAGALAALNSITQEIGKATGATSAPPPPLTVEAVGPLTVAEVFPNISERERLALCRVAEVLTDKGVGGLKEAVLRFLCYREALQGWTSEATLGCTYRVFLKLAANFRIRKLHNIVPVANLSANPALEHEYTTVVMKIGDRDLPHKLKEMDKELKELLGPTFKRESIKFRPWAEEEKALLAELPKRDAIKFRSVFGQLY